MIQAKGKLIGTIILSKLGGKVKIQYNTKTIELNTEKGRAYRLNERLEK